MRKLILALCVLVLIAWSVGCTMTIKPAEKGGCTLTGFGGGEGTINDKCSVKKGLITFPKIEFDN